MVSSAQPSTTDNPSLGPAQSELYRNHFTYRSIINWRQVGLFPTCYFWSTLVFCASHLECPPLFGFLPNSFFLFSIVLRVLFWDSPLPGSLLWCTQAMGHNLPWASLEPHSSPLYWCRNVSFPTPLPRDPRAYNIEACRSFVFASGWYIFVCFLFFSGCMACEILVPQPGIEPETPLVQCLNHWTTREVPRLFLKPHH